MIFWDISQRRSERVIIDSTFSTDRQTMMNNVVIKRQQYQFTVCILEELRCLFHIFVLTYHMH